jgi:two-component system CheB/CheR fusion protein
MSSSKKQARPQQGPSSRLAVIGIGASSGGLDAATKLMDALPAGTGLALILVQHLDAGHASMMAPLLASHTPMRVLEAAEGMRVEPEHLFIIPPGSYLAVEGGRFHLSKPPARHGARRPFDFLLASLAAGYGPQAGCVILSGTGADGSAGLLAISEKGGLVLAQEPTEAAYDGMPCAAIETGKVDRVLPVAKIPHALIAFRPGLPDGRSLSTDQSAPAAPSADVWLPKIVDLMRTQSSQDFSHYKPGTLQRRVERRIALLDIAPSGINRYLDLLQRDPRELDLLTKDLLIHVTDFFRDTAVFAEMEKTIIPALVDDHDPEVPIRIWVVGCSTGEEVYSIAMLCLERLDTLAHRAKLQIFASDIDAEAVAAAREGLYPTTIASVVSAPRLHRFFVLEDGGYRALPDLRSVIVFAVQDVLTDPPFSRLDLISCRNLLIYLRPDAQAKVIGLFHFALCPAGLLLLGSAETVANAEGRFDLVSKAHRIYRRLGRAPARPAPALRAAGPPGAAADGPPAPPRPDRSISAARPISPTAIRELGRQLVLDAYAPASVLINTANEILFSLGPIDKYLRLAPGHATHDLLAAARPGLRPKLAQAIETARRTNARTDISGRMTGGNGGLTGFKVDVVPVLEAGEELLLICVVETADAQAPAPALPEQLPQLAEIERELETARNEQQATLKELEVSRQEQRIATEEALSVNEEYQSTNEELLTSKEELQSLNEELTALNSQLQETLERQRTLGDDLQNILYSTDVATLFLDLDLRIRFFTPATKSVFAVISTDIGRPLADLAALTLNDRLEDEARTVLTTLEPLEREIETKGGVWFRRRILPYRARGDRVEGVVITFTDVTSRRHIKDALEAAKKQAESANAAKSRFLASASHDLRQPLQTLSLLQALLGKAVQGDKAQKLVVRLDETLGAITAMLDTLLDINEIEAGVTSAHLSVFPINGLLARMREEFTYHAEAKGLGLRIMPCSLDVRSDPRLLEQMLRNLLSNALKYTKTGRILVGCRRRGAVLCVEVWDTGIGIPAGEVERIFDEYRQVDNPARERSRGLGLGLAIVKRVGELLEHPIIVRSDFGRGSRFAVEVPIVAPPRVAHAIVPTGIETSVEMAADVGMETAGPAVTAPLSKAGRRAAILVVEDDPDLLAVLEQSLRDEGHTVTTAVDGPAALRQIAISTPELLLADYNLPNGLSGLDLAISLREAVGREVPAILLTGDISAETRALVAEYHVPLLIKPVRQNDLILAIETLLAAEPRPCPSAKRRDPPAVKRPTVFVVDDDPAVRAAIMSVLADDGLQAEAYADGESFLQAYRNGVEGCLLVDAYMPGMSGIDLLERLRKDGRHLPALMITGQSDVHMAVTAMKAGALDFIEKPVGRVELLASISRALAQSHDTKQLSDWRAEAARRVGELTPRQHQIMTCVLAGQPSKNIAADLGLSQRTVESHRAAVMRKTGATSMPALARLALAANAEG